jgi:sec-independent protein translocase protein TatA
MFRQIGPTEILVILGIVVLLFGGRKLPELARGSGRALRIFKSEVKGLQDEDDDTKPEALETTEAEKKPEQG